MTTATPYYYPAARDHSGAELRRELLIPFHAPSHALRAYRGPLLLGAVEGLTLIVGFWRVALG